VDETENGRCLKLYIGPSFLLVLPVHELKMTCCVCAALRQQPGEVSMDFHLVVSGGGKKARAWVSEVTE
jgi:hypothetical protein